MRGTVFLYGIDPPMFSRCQRAYRFFGPALSSGSAPGHVSGRGEKLTSFSPSKFTGIRRFLPCVAKS